MMYNFLDSNVIIGYIFSLDFFNYKAGLFISHEKYCFYSHNVKKEVIKIFNIKKNHYNSFLLILLRFFNGFSDNSLIGENDAHNYVSKLKHNLLLKKEDMHFAINVIWEDLDFNENHDAFEVKSIFHDFQNEFQGVHESRKCDIFNKLILIPNHTKKDNIIQYYIKKDNLGQIFHGEDENILLDANEFCKNHKDSNLRFVSADQDFIKAIEILMDKLCIEEVVNLKDFSNS